jgi:PhzF family phenazine biosynthesis protein
MKIPYFHVDAFTRRTFGGNAAGVCPLPEWLPPGTMQQIAAENRHAETAFFVPQGPGEFGLRWFTPTVEIDLCGHATLATAHVLWCHLQEKAERLTFHSKSGPLITTRHEGRIQMDFPSRPAAPAPMPADAKETLGIVPVYCGKARDYLLVLNDEDDVRGIRPDFARIAAWDAFAVIVTAPGRKVDFVSRFFAPGAGVPEDPATGSSHCTLVPYWAERLKKTKLEALQLSDRGAELFCELLGDRVQIGGEAVTYLTGTIEI